MDIDHKFLSLLNIPESETAHKISGLLILADALGLDMQAIKKFIEAKYKG